MELKMAFFFRGFPARTSPQFKPERMGQELVD
jgi:hypothetical protein